MSSKEQIKSIWYRLTNLLNITTMPLATFVRELLTVYSHNKNLSKEDLKKEMLQHIADNDLLGNGLGKEVIVKMLSEPIVVKDVTNVDVQTLIEEVDKFHQQSQNTTDEEVDKFHQQSRNTDSVYRITARGVYQQE